MSSLKDRGCFPEGFRIKISKYKQNPRKMFIGGLSRHTSNGALLEYLAQFGEVLDSVIKIYPDSGLSRGFGFVLFEDPATVEKVLQIKEHQLEGKKIEFKRAKAIQPASPPRKIFVGGLSPHMPVENVREYFSIFGEVEKIELPLYPRSSKRQAFGFITYSDADSLQHQFGKDTPSTGFGYPVAGDGGFHSEPTDYGASQGIFGADPNVSFDMFSDSIDLPTMFMSVPFEDPTEGDDFSHQIYGNFLNIYNDELLFRPDDGYLYGYSYEGCDLRPKLPSYDVQVNQVNSSGAECQRFYQLF
ncbi:heterogeneous nuclear ribonucleoprotein D-like [Octodon degus]|uniref:Heterogeneous nuclear ribonucleoprotein D-like n=1 Tax=Octodon degus TaxID=10160 RepID=A0A6P3FHY9_OCTDE|nr:heterogeneous nuclear ribonucleoprotein D-like [Octodon degus]